MSDADLDPISVAALALLQEVLNEMPAREDRPLGTEIWSREGTEVRSTRDLEKGRFELVIQGVPAVSVDLWPLLAPEADEKGA